MPVCVDVIDFKAKIVKTNDNLAINNKNDANIPSMAMCVSI